MKNINELFKENYKTLKKEMEKTTEGGKISHTHGLA
jgi:hypothetical protein